MTGQIFFLLSGQICMLYRVRRTGLSIDNSKIFFIHQSILVFVFFWVFLFWVVLVGEFLVQSVDRLFWVCFGLVLWVFVFLSFGWVGFCSSAMCR